MPPTIRAVDVVPGAAPAAVRIGCAGWSIPAPTAGRFPGSGSHLQRYARVLGMAEINSSFYRPHRAATYARWAESVPPGFRFSVKIPKTVTHGQRLAGSSAALLREFLDGPLALGPCLGCLLVQLPPSLAFDGDVAGRFLSAVRAVFPGAVAIEPRHASWFQPGPDRLLQEHRVARVLADPVLHAAGAQPGGWPGLVYCRLHGSPRTYYSSYPDPVLAALAARIRTAAAGGAEVWCVFDNTASGAAAGNAVHLMQLLAGH